MPPATDKFSTLPDAILCSILSKIPVKEAIRSSLLSKRWRFLYTQMPQLILSPHLLLGPLHPDPLSIATVENIISKILLLHSSDLEVFYLSIDVYPSARICNIDTQWRFTRDSVYKWVRCAAWRNVQHLTLCDSPEREIPPPALFSCTRLVTLTLYNYILSPLPTHFYGFNHLTTCNFNYMELTDQSLAHFVSHCPLLQNFSLHKCVGLQQPTISAPNITDLEVSDSVEALTVNCPKLNTLKAYLIKDLRVNGILFHEISCSIWELNMQGGSNLIGLKVESFSKGYNISAERFIDIIGSFKLLKLLVVFVGPLLKSEKEMDISLLSVFDRLPHLEQLYMGENFLSELANHAISLSLNSPLSNLRKIRVYIHLDGTSDREISVLGCLLQNTPALQVMELQLTDDADSESPMYPWFLEKVLYLNRASKQARIVV
eukprot:PITA_35108